ncbi:hypothetical protein IE53DRAFT_369263 [Violaceomyces palustris]|uniref:Uncharacterized protein n=1 Tax=Violaceomyces palustris TaxID=1673888 RepID=A0ACD0NW35_9BASI|nr:hypothetical protein IE53DRAFT_369263 [Violaceomyces palustris]
MDGASLAKTKAQWEAALQAAYETFRSLLADSSSKSWKQVPHPNGPPSQPSTLSRASGASAAGAASSKGKGKDSAPSSSAINSRLAGMPSSDLPTEDGRTFPFKLGSIKTENVVIHRRSGKGSEIFRAVADVPFEGTPDLFAFQSLLQTPDARSGWDRLVESGELVEQLDPKTRISKINYRLGWPASPRDAIIISRTMSDESTLIDVSTSLPRSPDAPAYLRPAPPSVRSHVHLMAWCIQVPSAPELPSTGLSQNGHRVRPTIKITAFWSWDLKGAWMGMPTGGLGLQLVELVRALTKQVREGRTKLPAIANFGNSVEILSAAFDVSRDTLNTEYTIIMEDEAARRAEDESEKDLDTLNALRERRRLDSAIEFSLPASEGWDVQVSVKGQIRSSQAADWRAVAEQATGTERVTLTVRHQRIQDPDDFVKAAIKIQRVAASSGLRLNNDLFPISQTEPRTPLVLTETILDDAASISGVSVSTSSTGGSLSGSQNDGSGAASVSSSPNLGNPAAAIAALIKRNYIYFTSLLQEPEAKWKHVSDARGVTVTQLDSIDPTLVVYRAEATFVGVGVWDLFSTINNPGARAHWDKGLDDAILVSDVNDLSALWHLKTKAAWPVSARDSVTIQTSYKSLASVHIFSFSTDDRGQFPEIPPVEPGTIRTQVDLRGWSVEALSPTTVHITMLEQSDPKGWTSKSAIPSAMISAVAGVGDYAIKFGGPPVATRLLGAHAKVSKYDHEKATFRLEYEATDLGENVNDAPNVECELRCDVETWANSLDLVVDPPPISVSCLRRHKLSQGGGGLWLTIEHVAASLEDDAARITVRKGASKEKGSVLVNGAHIKVDVDELKETEVQQLAKRKRTKPQRVPLDLNTPPTRPAAKNLDSSASSVYDSEASEAQPDPDRRSSGTNVAFAPTKRAETNTPSSNDFFSDEKPRQPMTCALDVLFLLRRIYAERSPDPAGNPAGWALVSERNGLFVRRKLMESISSTVFVQRGDKVVQGLSAEDLVNVVSSVQCRKQWDDKVESTTMLESYGNGATTSFITTRGSFPFRGRAFHLASMTARAAPLYSVSSPGSSTDTPITSSGATGPAVFFHASASFPDTNHKFEMSKVNPLALPVGKILIDGWILETLDPYASTNFQIPSTRCTHVVAIDYAGSLPVAVNTMWNSALPRSILQVEEFLKARGALPSVRSPPPCMQVLGDGRDEDQGLVWVLEDPARLSTLITSSFDPDTRNFDVLIKCGVRPLESEDKSRRNRPAAVSNASTTKGAASKAVAMTSSSPIEQPTEPASSLSRATSVTSINSSLTTPTPSTMRRRPSTIRADSRKTADTVLMDVEVELKHYSRGYDIGVSSELIRKRTAEDDDAKTEVRGDGPEQRAEVEKTFSLKAAPKSKTDLPIAIKVYDLPPSAVLAATLDPSARPRKHLVRLYLPTSSFLNPIEDPLTDQKAPEVPGWYHNLVSDGALVRIMIKPLNAPSPTGSALATLSEISTASVPPAKILVKSDGEKLDVVHVNLTSAMLQKEQGADSMYAQLRRALPSTPKASRGQLPKDVVDDRLPQSLQRPLAAAVELKAAPNIPSTDSGVKPGNVTKSTAEATLKGSNLKPQVEKGVWNPSTEGAGAKPPPDGKADTNRNGRASESTPMMSILGAYPLSRLGTGNALAASLTSVSSVTAKGSSVNPVSKDGGDARASLTGKDGGSHANTSKSESESTREEATVAISHGGGPTGFLSGRKYSLASLMLTFMIAFLMGSLFRALLTPSEFVLLPVQSASSSSGSALDLMASKQASASSLLDVATEEVERYLDLVKGVWAENEGRANPVQKKPGSGSSLKQKVQGSVAAAGHQPEWTLAWREIKRLVEIKQVGNDWNLVLAVIRR